MSNFLLFVMVAAIFVHQFLNFFLGVYSMVVAKATSTAAVEHSVEVFFAKLFTTVFSWFKHL